MWTDNTVYTDDKITIENFIVHRSNSLHEYIRNKNGNTNFTMWYKSLTHSDLTTRGKRTNSADGFERNLLYYLSISDMKNLQEQFPDRKFECAKQSNIGMPEDFYTDLKIPRIKRRKGHQTAKHNWISVNDYMKVYLVNDTLEYFTSSYSESIMKKLDKEMPTRWNTTNIILDKNNAFTKIDLHQAVHGLGVEADSLFHALRLTMFLNDSIIFVLEHSNNDPKMFILLEKNTLFYTIIGIKDRKWAMDERIRRYQERIMIKEGLTIEVPEKIYENEWDEVLLP